MLVEPHDSVLTGDRGGDSLGHPFGREAVDDVLQNFPGAGTPEPERPLDVAGHGRFATPREDPADLVEGVTLSAEQVLEGAEDIGHVLGVDEVDQAFAADQPLCRVQCQCECSMSSVRAAISGSAVYRASMWAREALFPRENGQ